MKIRYDKIVNQKRLIDEIEEHNMSITKAYHGVIEFSNDNDKQAITDIINAHNPDKKSFKELQKEWLKIEAIKNMNKELIKYLTKQKHRDNIQRDIDAEEIKQQEIINELN